MEERNLVVMALIWAIMNPVVPKATFSSDYLNNISNTAYQVWIEFLLVETRNHEYWYGVLHFSYTYECVHFTTEKKKELIQEAKQK